MQPEQLSSQAIGIFDSGVGGLSVLRALRARLPAAPMIYIGDAAYAPYGERPAAEVRERCERIVAYLASQGATLIVIACNTATVLAIGWLRARWPALVFVGVEPGVKPAAQHSRTRRIAVLATPATAASARLHELIERHAAGVHVHVQPFPGLAAAIERGVLQGHELDAVLQPGCDVVRAAEVDTVVLGCTHYAFVADAIQAALGADITLVDTATAVAERVASLSRAGASGDETAGARILSTGRSVAMPLLLQQCPALEVAAVEPLVL
jgi:glutamate racemase